MEKYEVLYILTNELEDEKKQAIIDRLSAVITDGKGTVEEVSTSAPWGTRTLAYPINKKREGYYVLMNMSADAATVKELGRIMNITDDVVRYMVLRKE